MNQMEDKATQEVSVMLEGIRNRLVHSHQSIPGDACALEFSNGIDELLKSHCDTLIERNPAYQGMEEKFAIVATGGYGRRELNLFSDIDLLFLFRGEPNETEARFIKAFLYPLWNLKLDMGYSIKTIKQVLEETGKDTDLATSLFDRHVVWGNEAIAEELDNDFRVNIVLLHETELTRSLIQSTRSRHEKYANTRLLLEPNIKESPGGLRDMHVLRWLGFIHYGSTNLEELTNHGLLTDQEQRRLSFAHSYLIGLRNSVHLLDNRKVDLLTVERQIKIAAEWGIHSLEHLLPEEQLMRSYYEHAGAVERLAQRVVKRFENGSRPQKGIEKRRLRARRMEGYFWMRDQEIWIDARQVTSISAEPLWMMQLFLLAAQHGLQPDYFTMNFVENRIGDVDDKMRRSPINRDRFLTILKNPRHSARTLRYMHRCGFLDRYIPEFALVRNLPRIDYYHQFTVDEHLLRSVASAVGLLDEKGEAGRSHASRVARQILRWDLLTFALLMHDVGKGEGRGHVLRGAHIMQRVSERMNLSAREAEILHDLVINHQKMSALALKRNPNDPNIAEELAKDVGDPEMLRMLYVMTCCDLRAVSDQSWNDWRASLLEMLYEHTMDVLMGRKDRRRQRIPSNEAMIDHVAEEMEKQCLLDAEGQEREEMLHDLRSLVNDLPERYRQSTSPAIAARHICLARQLNEKNTVAWELEAVEGGNFAFLHCVAYDTPGLFTNLCGALSSRNYNILAAQIYTATNGLCIDVFHIQDAQGNPPQEIDVLERLRQKLMKILRGEKKEDWGDYLPSNEPVISSARLDQRPPEVMITNDSADTHTLIEVQAPDRPGLLFDITSLLDRHRLNIDLAIVATGSYSIVDVFYVTDWENNRLGIGAQTENLRKELLDVVSPRNTVAPAEEAGKAT